MTILPPSHAAERAMFQTFNYCVELVIEASRTVVLVECITEEWVRIAVKEKQAKIRPLMHQANAAEQLRKEQGAKTKQAKPMGDAIFTNFFKTT
jgi:hypothetical protein